MSDKSETMLSGTKYSDYTVCEDTEVINATKDMKVQTVFLASPQVD